MEDKIPSPSSTGVEEVTDSEFSSVKDHLDEVDISTLDISDEAEAEDTDSKVTTQETSSNEPTGDGHVPLGKFVKSKFVLLVLDLVLPVAIAKISTVVGYRINKQWLKLTKEDREILDEPLQDFLNYIKFNPKNPTWLLLLAVSMVYGTKLIEISEKAEKIKKKPKDQDAPVYKDASEGLQAVNTSVSVNEKLDNLNKKEEAWTEDYTVEQVALIRATRKRRNKSFQDAIDWLKGKGEL